MGLFRKRRNDGERTPLLQQRASVFNETESSQPQKPASKIKVLVTADKETQKVQMLADKMLEAWFKEDYKTVEIIYRTNPDIAKTRFHEKESLESDPVALVTFETFVANELIRHLQAEERQEVIDILKIGIVSVDMISGSKFAKDFKERGIDLQDYKEFTKQADEDFRSLPKITLLSGGVDELISAIDGIRRGRYDVVKSVYKKSPEISEARFRFSGDAGQDNLEILLGRKLQSVLQDAVGDVKRSVEGILEVGILDVSKIGSKYRDKIEEFGVDLSRFSRESSEAQAAPSASPSPAAAAMRQMQPPVGRSLAGDEGASEA